MFHQHKKITLDSISRLPPLRYLNVPLVFRNHVYKFWNNRQVVAL
ncbi:hypothetical protein T4C_10280 [Trichinella pseudospiralis]|uniref:Uncharacterized protein n=1 Tax=Trichinella pseudospiralis TaxID=6337 RepID=A0A0V1GKV3_TRIPS|nr:hypothetical protein T4C_10280 [Trichinella pseudospiralis]